MREGYIPVSEQLSKGRKGELKKTLLGLVLSIGLHGGIALTDRHVREAVSDEASEIKMKLSEKTETTERAGRELLESMFATETEADFKDSIEKSGKDLVPIAFYLKSESFHGISEKETEENAEVFEALREQFTMEAKNEPNKLKVFYNLSQEEGRYDPDSALLANILKRDKAMRRGNCEARAKFMDSMASQIYPDAEKKLQWFNGDEKKDKAPHVRLIIKINKSWYALEGLPEKLSEADLAGTTLTDTDVFKKSYLQKEAVSEEELLSSGGNNSDSYFNVKFEKPPIKTFDGSDEEETVKTYNERLATTYEKARFKKPDYFKVKYLTADEIKARQEKQKTKEEKKDQIPKKFTKEEIKKIKQTGLLVAYNEKIDFQQLKGIKLEEIWLTKAEVNNFSMLDLTGIKTLDFEDVTGDIDPSKFKDSKLEILRVSNLKNHDELKNVIDLAVNSEKLKVLEIHWTGEKDLDPNFTEFDSLKEHSKSGLLKITIYLKDEIFLLQYAPSGRVDLNKNL